MLASRKNLCKCIYTFNVYESVTVLSIVLEFLFSLVLIIIGLLVNFRFKKKLKEERRARPPGRKGNVIEPLMRWYQIVAMVIWTFVLISFWLWSHEILPADWFANCWNVNIPANFIRVGRSIIAYNSFFCALIRYLYIVHHDRAKFWEFDKVGKVFQLISTTFPIFMELIRLFTEEDTLGAKSTDRFKRCLAFNEGLNDTTNIFAPKPITLELTLLIFPEALVEAVYYMWLTITTLIFSNVLEGYLYFKIFQTIRRYNN